MWLLEERKILVCTKIPPPPQKKSLLRTIIIYEVFNKFFQRRLKVIQFCPLAVMVKRDDHVLGVPGDEHDLRKRFVHLELILVCVYLSVHWSALSSAWWHQFSRGRDKDELGYLKYSMRRCVYCWTDEGEVNLIFNLTFSIW